MRNNLKYKSNPLSQSKAKQLKSVKPSENSPQYWKPHAHILTQRYTDSHRYTHARTHTQPHTHTDTHFRCWILLYTLIWNSCDKIFYEFAPSLSLSLSLSVSFYIGKKYLALCVHNKIVVRVALKCKKKTDTNPFQSARKNNKRHKRKGGITMWKGG